jgi:hypothetical protein
MGMHRDKESRSFAPLRMTTQFDYQHEEKQILPLHCVQGQDDNLIFSHHFMATQGQL